MNSIALVKPEKAKMLENMLIQMAQRGQLSGKVSPVYENVNAYLFISSFQNVKKLAFI